MATYYVSVAANDYYYDGASGGNVHGTTTLKAAAVSNFFPPFTRTAYAKVDTSGIPDTDIISAATLTLTANTYNATKGTTKTYKVWMWTGSVYTLIHSATWAAGNINITLTGTELGYIDKTSDTRFRVTIDDPGSGKSREMFINAYETSQATAFRMDVTHAPAAADFTPKVMIF